MEEIWINFSKTKRNLPKEKGDYFVLGYLGNPIPEVVYWNEEDDYMRRYFVNHVTWYMKVTKPAPPEEFNKPQKS